MNVDTAAVFVSLILLAALIGSVGGLWVVCDPSPRELWRAMTGRAEWPRFAYVRTIEASAHRRSATITKLQEELRERDVLLVSYRRRQRALESRVA